MQIQVLVYRLAPFPCSIRGKPEADSHSVPRRAIFALINVIVRSMPSDLGINSLLICAPRFLTMVNWEEVEMLDCPGKFL